jgi:hypothetical protein
MQEVDMSVTEAMIGTLRRMVAEPGDETYSDEALESILEAHAVIDIRGELPYSWDGSTTPPTKVANENWIPTYDLHLSAAEIWEEKAAAAASAHDYKVDGAEFANSQVYGQCMKSARYHRARRYARNQQILVK